MHTVHYAESFICNIYTKNTSFQDVYCLQHILQHYTEINKSKSLDAACLRPLLFQNTRNKTPILENALKNVCNKLFYLSKLCPVSLLSYDNVYYISVNTLISY